MLANLYTSEPGERDRRWTVSRERGWGEVVERLKLSFWERLE
jgi:hypothetical protein